MLPAQNELTARILEVLDNKGITLWQAFKKNGLKADTKRITYKRGLEIYLRAFFIGKTLSCDLRVTSQYR